MSAFLADSLAVFHALLVIYVAGGLLAILAGLWRKWAWTRRFWFRFTHMMICLAVVLFELAGQACPLTSVERYFRDQADPGSSYGGGFIAHYVSETIHLEVPPQMLSGPMLAVVALIVLLYRWAGPRSDVGVKKEEPADSEGASPPGQAPPGRGPGGYVLLLLLVAGVLPLMGLGTRSAWSDFQWSLVFVVLGLVLCLPYARSAGLVLGETKRWQNSGGRIAALWVVPPLLVIFVGPMLTEWPYKESTWGACLLSSMAQQLVFHGFVYSWLVKRWGEELGGWRGAFRWPVAGAALAHALSQWPYAFEFGAAQMVLHLTYVSMGTLWLLQMRRWSGSLLPGATSHLLASYLACVIDG